MKNKLSIYYSRIMRIFKFFIHSILTIRSKKDILMLIARIYESKVPEELKTKQVLGASYRGGELLKSHKFSYIFNSNIKISFIYPYFNKKDVINFSINSIESQEVPEEIKYEIIVIDDGSELKEVSKIIPDRIIYLWRNKFNYGISRSRNLGAKIANGEYFVFIDPDLILNPKYLKSMMDQFQQFGNRVILTGYLNDYHYKGSEDPRVAWGVWENPDVLTSRFLCIAGGNMAIHRDLFFEIGGFDEDLIYGGVEDIVFGYLASQLPDTKVIYSSGMTVSHIPHPEGLAHAKPNLSWDIVAVKYPNLYIDYIKKGLR